MTFSIKKSFQARRASGLVKSQKAPAPPHHDPTANFELSLLSLTNTSRFKNSSNFGCINKIPGLTFGTFCAPFSFMALKYSRGFLNLVVFQMKTQRLLL